MAYPPLPDLSDTGYWEKIRHWAKTERIPPSDGCTMSMDIYIDACYEHDYHWEHFHTLDGRPITPFEANERFRDVIQMFSHIPKTGVKLGKLSPVSYARYLAVSLNAIRKSIFKLW